MYSYSNINKGEGMGYLDKVVRKPIYSKSNMSGMVKDYKKLYDIVKLWREVSVEESEEEKSKLKGIIYGMGYGIGDAPYFGWTGEALQEERKTFNAVEKAYTDLLFALEDALEIESEVYASRVDENGYYKG